MKRIIIFAALMGCTSAAQAAVISLNFNILATDFPANAPVDPIVGRFSVTFDNSADVAPTSAGLVVSDFSLPITPLFKYRKDLDVLTVGNKISGSGFVLSSNNNDFGFALRATSGSYFGDVFAYSSSAASGFFRAGRFDVVPVAIPEPASWALMIGGFAATGASLRKRSRATVVA